MFEKTKSGEYVIVTTNSTIKKDGAVVMGRGAAFQLKNKEMGIDRIFGRLITMRCHSGGFYGLVLHSYLGAFQVKYHFKDKAELSLIRKSTRRLKIIAQIKPDCIFNLNFPGICNGKLKREHVLPIITKLPDNIHIWELL